MKSFLLVLLALSSTYAVAGSKAQSFRSSAEYVSFLAQKPGVKVVSVTSLTGSVDKCPNNSSAYCYSSETTEILVTYEE